MQTASTAATTPATAADGDPYSDGTYDRLVGALIHQAIWHARMSQAELGRLLGEGKPLDPASVNRRLRGKISWKAWEVSKAASALGLTVADLTPSGDDLEAAATGGPAIAARRSGALYLKHTNDHRTTFVSSADGLHMAPDQSEITHSDRLVAA